MNLKRFLIIALLSFMVLGCAGTVSAGLFDFLDSDMEEHDFGEFTAKVPKGLTFNESVQPNGITSVEQLAKDAGGSISINYSDDKWADEKYASYFHPNWSTGGDKDYIVIEYVDSEEDNVTSDNVVSTLYDNDVEPNGTLGNHKVYYWNSFTQNIVKIDNADKTAFVLVRSDNEDILNKVAKSVEFK